MKLVLLPISLLLMLAMKKCKKSSDAIPVCIQSRIDSIGALPRWNPPAEVHEYEYRGQRVFLFTADCCDQFNTVFDEHCQYICAPTGGFTGRGDRRCEDFHAVAKEGKLVWKDMR